MAVSARPDVTLDDYRAQFQLPDDAVYLDHAATGFLARRTFDAASAFLAGRAGRVPGRPPNDFPADLKVIDRARQRAAALVGAEPAHVCVIPNTSAGLNLVAEGLDWQPGDRVAVPGCEFPANLLPWLGLEDRGVAVDRIPHRDGAFSVADVEAALRPETRVVALSAVQFLSGFRCDLEGVGALCRERGVWFVVDGIQAVGAVRVDVAALGIDLLAVGAHKWLGAMQGGGFAAVAPRLMERLRPVRGWLNGPVDWDDFAAVSLALHDDATRFHTGTMPTAALYALDAALGLVLDVGPDVVEQAVLSNARRLADGLDALGVERVGAEGPPEAGIVTVRAEDPAGLHAHLASRGVTCSMRSRLVRFAPHAHTSPEAIDAALDGVASFQSAAVS